MRFISPGSLFGETIRPLDKKAIQLGRKKLLAELELGTGDSIELHGIRFSKSEIIDYFEELQKDNIADYYNTIEEDRVLLGFLEESSIGRNDRFNDNPLYLEEPFIHWISPYYFSAFTSFANSCFRQSDQSSSNYSGQFASSSGQFPSHHSNQSLSYSDRSPSQYTDQYDNLSALLANRPLMTDHDIEQSWLFIAKILTNNIALIDYYRNQKKDRNNTVSIDKVSPLMDYFYTRLIQLLPENRFSGLRDKYAFVMMQACIYIFNNDKGNRSSAKMWMENAASLAVSEETRTEIADKLKEMNKASRKSDFALIGRIIWIAIIVGRAATCNFNNSDTYHYQNTPVYTLPQGDSARKLLRPFLDSVGRENPYIPANRLPRSGSPGDSPRPTGIHPTPLVHKLPPLSDSIRPTDTIP